MKQEEKDRRVAGLVLAARSVLAMFLGGYNPTEQQLNALDGAILNLTALKTCGHAIIEDCDCLGSEA